MPLPPCHRAGHEPVVNGPLSFFTHFRERLSGRGFWFIGKVPPPHVRGPRRAGRGSQKAGAGQYAHAFAVCARREHSCSARSARRVRTQGPAAERRTQLQCCGAVRAVLDAERSCAQTQLRCCGAVRAVLNADRSCGARGAVRAVLNADRSCGGRGAVRAVLDADRSCGARGARCAQLV